MVYVRGNKYQAAISRNIRSVLGKMNEFEALYKMYVYASCTYMRTIIAIAWSVKVIGELGN